MGLLLAVLGRDRTSLVRRDDLEPWLPLPDGDVREWTSRLGAAQLFRVSWGGLLDRPLTATGDDAAFAYEGLLGSPALERGGIVDLLRAPAPPGLDGIPGSGAAVVVDGDELRAYAGAGGEYGLYVVATEAAVLVSNRPALLLGLSGRADLDAQAVWLAVHGHGPRGLRAWQGLRQLAPGERLVVRRDDHGLHVTSDLPDLAPWFPELRGREAGERLEASLTYAAEELARLDIDAADWALPLSGGKDSRAVLAMVASSGRLPELGSAWTVGPPYSLDVLTAQHVARVAGIQRHELRRPPLIPTTGDLVRRALGTLFSTQGAVSLFDTHQIAAVRKLTLTGHEHSLRPSWWSGVPTDDFDALFAGVLARKPLQTLQLLTPDAERALEEDFRSIFQGLLDRGVPLDRLANTAYWASRISSWTPGMMGGNQYGQALVSPLMSGDMLATSFALPLAAVEGEAVHYRAIARSGLPLAGIPFANDRWAAFLPQGLALIGSDDKPPAHVTPYTTSPALGALGRQMAPTEKQDLTRMFAPVLGELLRTHAAQLPYLDAARTAEAFDRAAQGEQVMLLDMISLMGVGAILVFAEYGVDLFDRRRSADVEADLRGRLAPPAGTAVPDRAEALRAMVETRDGIIGELVAERRRLNAELESSRTTIASLEHRTNAQRAALKRLRAKVRRLEAATQRSLGKRLGRRTPEPAKRLLRPVLRRARRAAPRPR
jgi:hypothetical protein